MIASLELKAQENLLMHVVALTEAGHPDHETSLRFMRVTHCHQENLHGCRNPSRALFKSR